MTRYTPLWEQAGQYAASVDRRLIGALWPVPAVTGCAVTVASGMTVNVAAGTVAVPASNGTGSVLCASDASEQVTLAAAPASGSNRYDLIVCQARGNDLDGGANNDFLFQNVTGTAAATPTVPAVPANAVALAQVYVPGGSASVTAGNITNLRPIGGLLAPVPYVEVTANQGGIVATVVDLTGLSLTFTVNGNRRLKMTGHTALQSTVAGDYGRIDLTDLTGATTYQTAQSYLVGSAAAVDLHSCEVFPAGLVTVKLRAVRSVGTGTLTMAASGVSPAFLLVEDLGPAT